MPAEPFPLLRGQRGRFWRARLGWQSRQTASMGAGRVPYRTPAPAFGSTGIERQFRIKFSNLASLHPLSRSQSPPNAS
jgi:hypothetical protein